MTTDMKTTLVIPSNRPALLAEFLKAWAPVKDWDKTIIVFDGPEAPLIEGADECDVYDWSDIDNGLKDDSWIVSRKNAGLRIFGYLKAAEHGAKVIATIDDDCRPIDSKGLMGAHVENLYRTPAWVSSDRNLIARGVPYRQRGELSRVMLNVGLWRCVGDYDAPRSLVEGADLNHFEPDPVTRVAPRGQFVPISTMSLAFRIEALPLMYLPLMGEGQPYDRFDDIWGGIIAKRVCDHLGWSITIGRPIVDHQRASDPFRNLVKEAAGIQRNETFWQEIDGIELWEISADECMLEIATGLVDNADPHTAKLGKAIKRWVHYATST
jgi:reversibly glycosylated polypeptide/UDP-arabinopyranose mutase